MQSTKCFHNKLKIIAYNSYLKWFSGTQSSIKGSFHKKNYALSTSDEIYYTFWLSGLKIVYNFSLQIL